MAGEDREKEFKSWREREFGSTLVSPFKLAEAWANHRFSQIQDAVMDKGMNLEEAWHGTGNG